MFTIHTDPLHRIAYATDASAYREVPQGVAFPENEQDIIYLIETARERKTHLIPRAGGTSIAGQVVGSGIVVDISKHFKKILEINKEERWARVQPGVVLDELNLALEPYGLFFSPETSTSNRCCIGGMFGNNSCGSHSLVYGSTRHHVLEARGVLCDGSVEVFKTYTIKELEERFGTQFWETESDSLIQNIYSQLIHWALDEKTVQLIEENFPDKSLRRRSCGYAIDEVIEDLHNTAKSLKERTINLCKVLAGSEGTLAFITEIKVDLDPLPPKEKMVVCAHCDTLQKSFLGNLVALKFHPAAVELMDRNILELSKENVEQQKNRFFVQGDPAAILIIELRGETRAEIDALADQLEKALMENEKHLVYACSRVYGSEISKVWSLRKAGLGLLTGMKGDAKPIGVIEDTAVAPEKLPAYMADFAQMLENLGLSCVYHAHISTGELHLRPIINIKEAEGLRKFREVAYQTALLVKKYKGSLSGEHGDGRLRGEFIQLMYGDEVYTLMQDLKKRRGLYPDARPQEMLGPIASLQFAQDCGHAPDGQYVALRNRTKIRHRKGTGRRQDLLQLEGRLRRMQGGGCYWSQKPAPRPDVQHRAMQRCRRLPQVELDWRHALSGFQGERRRNQGHPRPRQCATRNPDKRLGKRGFRPSLG